MSQANLPPTPSSSTLFPLGLAAETLPGGSQPAVTGVPQESWGRLLQRGGSEILLDRVPDRFAVLPKPDQAGQPIDPSSIPGAIAVESLGPGMKLWQVVLANPADLDATMQTLRSAGRFEYVSHVYQAPQFLGETVYLDRDLTILFAPTLDEGAIATIVAPHGLDRLRPLQGLDHAYIYRLTDRSPANPLKIANALMGTPGVLSAEPNAIIATQRHYRPSDTLYSYQWYLQNSGGNQLATGSHIDVEKAWDITRGSRSIVVAVLDDGFDLNHPDLQGTGKIVSPKDFKDNDFSPLPGSADESHGTSCAGVAVAEETGTGVVGVAPGCALMPVRTTGYLDDQSVEQIFDWCTDHGASVISCSWGPSAVSYALTTRQRLAIARAASQGRGGKGCVITFAAGNANRPVVGTVNESGWPNNTLSGPTEWLSGFAVHPDVIAVSASTSLGRKAAYSNWGQGVSVCAPSNNAPAGIWLPETGAIATPPRIAVALTGLGVFTVDRLGSAGYSSADFTGDFGGTSSACPVVAGVCALVLSANPNLTAAQVKQILQETADKIVDPNPDPQLGLRYGNYDANGYSLWFGYGKVNAAKAVARAKALAGGSPSPAPNPGPTPTPIPAPQPSPTPGSDDVSGHWAEAFLRPLISRGVLTGFGNGSILPDNKLTRGQFAAMVAKAFNGANLRASAKFWDVPATFWGAAAIDRAYRMGFLAGFPDGSFRPNVNLTRAQALVALVNGLRLTGGMASDLARYADQARIPSFARTAIATATQRRLVVNYPDLSYLNADRDSSRAEVAAFIYQALVSLNQLPALNSPYIVNPSTSFTTPPPSPDPSQLAAVAVNAFKSVNPSADPSANPAPELPRPDLANTGPFSDLGGHWADRWIRPLVAARAIAGFADGTFRPDQIVTRGQLAAHLVQAFGPLTSKRSAPQFSDVPPTTPEAPAIVQAYEAAFLSGKSATLFGPNDPVTRLQLAIALSSGLDWPDADTGWLNGLDDRDRLPTWARNRIAGVVAQGLRWPQPSVHQFAPDRPLSRADLAVALQQALVVSGRLAPIDLA